MQLLVDSYVQNFNILRKNNEKIHVNEILDIVIRTMIESNTFITDGLESSKKEFVLSVMNNIVSQNADLNEADDDIKMYIVEIVNTLAPQLLQQQNYNSYVCCGRNWWEWCNQKLR